jgi:hypothetical protein
MNAKGVMRVERQGDLETVRVALRHDPLYTIRADLGVKPLLQFKETI